MLLATAAGIGVVAYSARRLLLKQGGVAL